MFKKILLTAALLGASTSFVYAQSSEPSATSFRAVEIAPNAALIQPQANKVTLIEFFWYGCPHCYHMEPMVHKLVEEKKDVVEFKRYPVAFPRWESGAKLYFTVEAMGLEDKLHNKIFKTIQEDRNNIMDDKDKRDAFLKAEGVDVAKFNETYESFGVNTKMGQAKEVVKNYKIDSSPAFVVNNAYLYSPGINGSYQNTIDGLRTQIDKLTKK